MFIYCPTCWCWMHFLEWDNSDFSLQATTLFLMSVCYATVRISPWHWLSLRISSMAWSIPKVSPRTPHVWRNTFNKRQVLSCKARDLRWGVGTLSRLKVAMSVVRQEVELLTPPPSLSPRHYNHNWFPLRSEPESQCNNVGKQLPTIPWAALYYYYYSGSDQVHTATQILQHHVHRRPGGRGVLQHRGGAASQEVGHQPGPRLPCEVSLPDWGETPAEWFQRQVRSDSLTSLRLLPNSIIRFKLPSIQLEKIQPEMRSG